MKCLLYSIGLLLLTVACESDIFPRDLLYQRWELERTRQGDGPWTMYNLVQNDTEYRPDGTLIYRKEGQVKAACCQPLHFRRQKNDLIFADVASCGLALCAGASSQNGTITQLTDTLLELTDGQRVTQYKAVK